MKESLTILEQISLERLVKLLSPEGCPFSGRGLNCFHCPLIRACVV